MSRPPRTAQTARTFRTTLVATGGNNVGIVVLDDVVAAFERGKRVPGVVTIGGSCRYRYSIASMGGRSPCSFNAETREATGRSADDDVEVRLDLNDAPRVVEVPAELAAELAKDPAANEARERLRGSQERARAGSITSAKSADSRSRVSTRPSTISAHDARRRSRR